MSGPHEHAVQIPPAGHYRIDPARSTISFATRHMFGLGPVRGTFALRDGEIEVADPVPESSARATVSAAGFESGNPSRDKMVRSATYLDADNHPDIVFASTGLENTEAGWVLHGSLTVRGQDRPVDLRIEQAKAEDADVTLQAATTIDRYEFGLTAMKGITGRRLHLRLDLTAAPTSTPH